MGDALRRNWRWIAIGAAATVTLGACADDDTAAGSNASTEVDEPADEPDDIVAFCDAIDDTGLAVSIGDGYEGLDPALAAAEQIAPDEISDDVTTMADENRAQVAAGPPPEGEPPTVPPDDFFAAAAAAGDYIADNCGYELIDVTATDHEFAGIPADTSAGTTLIRITNDGTEYHEVLLQRVKPGETRSIEEILALPEEEGGDLLDYVGNAFAPPGQGNWTVVELSAGRHAAMCFVPAGSTTREALRTGQADDTSQAHATEGMHAEMQVS